jgi:HEAT repeat protein
MTDDEVSRLIAVVTSTALADESAVVRLEAAYAFGQLGRRARKAVPALKDALGNEDAKVRHRADELLAIVAEIVELKDGGAL